MKINTPACIGCGESAELEVDPAEYQRWVDGELIQVAMPMMSASDRERFISGWCEPCWSKMFN